MKLAGSPRRAWAALACGLLGIGVAAGLSGCGPTRRAAAAELPAPTSTSTSTSTTMPAPQPPVSVVAQAGSGGVDVYQAPGDPTPWQTLPGTRALGGPQVLLVVDRIYDWLQVALPIRPNGTTGWIRASDVTLSTHDYRIVVQESAHVITFYHGFDVIDQEPIAVGKQATPTPGGHFYTTDFVKVANPYGPYGPYAFGLSGFSDVLTSFAGGPGQLAIHGTNEPWVLGHDASHGCIRMSNAGITRMAQILPLGVPVTVLA